MNYDHKHIQNYNILTVYICVVLINMSYLSWGCTLHAEGTRDRWGSPAMPQVQCPRVPTKKPIFHKASSRLSEVLLHHVFTNYDIIHTFITNDSWFECFFSGKTFVLPKTFQKPYLVEIYQDFLLHLKQSCISSKGLLLVSS